MRVLFAAALAALLAGTADARPRRGASYPATHCQPAWAYPPAGGAVVAGGGCPGGVCPVPAAVPATYPVSVPSGAGVVVGAPAGVAAGGDALDEVNAKRAARGLRPYLRDDGLAAAAHAAAAFRARHRLFGHTANDFQFLPPGTSAAAAGCAAYPAHYGFLACAVYDGYTHAGAASVVGDDGRVYHHLFVR